MIHWLELCASTARVMGSLPGQGTKIPYDTQHEKKKKKEGGRERNTAQLNRPKLIKPLLILHYVPEHPYDSVASSVKWTNTLLSVLL